MDLTPGQPATANSPGSIIDGSSFRTQVRNLPFDELVDINFPKTFGDFGEWRN